MPEDSELLFAFVVLFFKKNLFFFLKKKNLKIGTEVLSLSFMQMFLSSIKHLTHTRVIYACRSVFLAQTEETEPSVRFSECRPQTVSSGRCPRPGWTFPTSNGNVSF